MGDLPPAADLSGVPVFPLPGVVLLPTAVLPLHIFEPRYRAMTRAALDRDGLIAMGILSPGWQKTYHANPAIEPAVCIGKILSYKELPDGKYNFLLQGKARARVLSEIKTDEPFRRLSLERIEESPASQATLDTARAMFVRLFASGFLAGTSAAKTFEELLAGPMKTPELSDLIAFNCIDDLTLKQYLLAEGDVAARVQAIVQELSSHLPARTGPRPSDYRNPSVN